MNIFGSQYDVNDLRRRVGAMDQVAGIRMMQWDDGRARPARAALFHTGSGLSFTVALDRGMDLAHADFQGRPMGWRATAGDAMMLRGVWPAGRAGARRGGRLRCATLPAKLAGMVRHASKRERPDG